jgi:hypothetical protein
LRLRRRPIITLVGVSDLPQNLNCLLAGYRFDRLYPGDERALDVECKRAAALMAPLIEGTATAVKGTDFVTFSGIGQGLRILPRAPRMLGRAIPIFSNIAGELRRWPRGNSGEGRKRPMHGPRPTRNGTGRMLGERERLVGRLQAAT